MCKNLLKTAVMAMVAVCILMAAPQNTFAQSKKLDKQLQKEKDKEFKEKIKEYDKGGWKLVGGSHTLKVDLLKHYKKLENEQNQEFVGEATNCTSLNACRTATVTNAQNRYATLASAYIRGDVEAIVAHNDNMPEIEISKMIAKYANLLEANLSNLFEESYSMVKNNNDGTKQFQVQTIFIINEEKAGLARKRAMERSLQETKITIEEAEEISKSVLKRFKIE
jgi:hypothetical protein